MSPSELDSLRFTTKRDVKSMASQLAELETGSIVEAGFAQDRYGHFSITGSVVALAGGYRVVAARQIESRGGPDSTLRSLEVGATLADDPGRVEDATGIQHGDAVTATFEHGLYGRFQVTGVAVLTQSEYLLRVGEWLLAIDGTPARWLQGVRRLSGPDEHGLPIPSRSVDVLTQPA